MKSWIVRAEHLSSLFTALLDSGVSEALQEMSVGPLAVLAACLAEAESHKRNDNMSNHLALCSIVQPIKEYWYNMAMKDAEEYIE